MPQEAGFDIIHYINSPNYRKLRMLAQAVGMNVTQVASAMGVSENDAKAMLRGEGVDTSRIYGPMDHLITVLMFVYRFGERDIKKMRELFNTQGQFHGITVRPPWDNEALCDFLTRSGLPGVMKAVEWIHKARI